MFHAMGTTLALLVFIGVSLCVCLYCCLCHTCRRLRRSSTEETMPRKHCATPRRMIEIRPSNQLQNYNHPIVERAQIPSSSLHRSNRTQVTTISVIDPQTKLSLNPNIRAEEPPPSYDELFP